MSRSFNGTSDVAKISVAPITSGPITLFAWFNASAFPASGADGMIVGTANNALNGYIFLEIRNTAGTSTVAGNAAGAAAWTHGTTLSTNTWYAGAVTFTGSSGTNGKVYLNAANPVTSGSINPFANAPTNTGCGATPLTSPASFLNGKIADAAIWNVVLTQTELTALANGARPYTIRPGSLKGYWPLDGLQSPEIDLSGLANNLTLTGTASAFGPPYFQLTPRWPIDAPIIVPAAIVSSFLAARAMRANQVYTGYATM